MRVLCVCVHCVFKLGRTLIKGNKLNSEDFKKSSLIGPRVPPNANQHIDYLPVLGLLIFIGVSMPPIRQSVSLTHSTQLIEESVHSTTQPAQHSPHSTAA